MTRHHLILTTSLCAFLAATGLAAFHKPTMPFKTLERLRAVRHEEGLQWYSVPLQDEIPLLAEIQRHGGDAFGTVDYSDHGDVYCKDHRWIIVMRAGPKTKTAVIGVRYVPWVEEQWDRLRGRDPFTLPGP